MLVTALAPVIGYDKASKIAHHAMDNDLTLKEAALDLGYVTEAEFDRVVDPTKMVKPYVATDAAGDADRLAPDAAPVEEVAAPCALSLQVGRLLLLNGADTETVETAVARFATAFGCDAHLMVTYEALLLTIVAGSISAPRSATGFRR